MTKAEHKLWDTGREKILHFVKKTDKNIQLQVMTNVLVSKRISSERSAGIKSAPNLLSKLGNCIEFKLAVQPHKV